jgi:hypothetical protein
MRKRSFHPATEHDNGTRPRQKHLWRKTSFVVPLVLVLMVIGAVVIGGWHAANSHAANSHAASPCTPNALLVNPCRPWFGAAAHGNPGTPNDPLSQADYMDKLVGQKLDIFRFYHRPVGPNGLADLPLDKNNEDGRAELSLVNRANTYIQVTWKPATTWAAAGGGNASINAEIKQVAKNIADVAPHKIFLIVWVEPENDVSAFDNKAEQTACQSDPHFKGLKGKAGTPDQYKALWQNVETIFKNTFQQLHVTSNVVWVMNYMSYPAFFCLVPSLWPGNQLVDWVLYDTYARGSQTYAETAGVFYHLLQKESSASADFDSKPWGLGEFNDCTPATPQDAITYFHDVKAAFQANTYPKLDLYSVYASTGNDASPGCLTNYNASGQPFPTKQAAFNQLATAVLNK